MTQTLLSGLQWRIGGSGGNGAPSLNKSVKLLLISKPFSCSCMRSAVSFARVIVDEMRVANGKPICFRCLPVFMACSIPLKNVQSMMSLSYS